MFTVKWIADNGAEMLYNARDVSYTPGNAVAPAPVHVRHARSESIGPLVARDITRACVSFYVTGQQSSVDGDSHVTIDTGRIYVMNAAGRTVADYVLSTNEFPHGLAPRQAA